MATVIRTEKRQRSAFGKLIKVLPIREIAAVLRRSCPVWAHKEVAGGGHMAPLARPDLINPIVGSFLDA